MQVKERPVAREADAFVERSGPRERGARAGLIADAREVLSEVHRDARHHDRIGELGGRALGLAEQRRRSAAAGLHAIDVGEQRRRPRDGAQVSRLEVRGERGAELRARLRDEAVRPKHLAQRGEDAASEARSAGRLRELEGALELHARRGEARGGTRRSPRREPHLRLDERLGRERAGLVEQARRRARRGDLRRARAGT